MSWYFLLMKMVVLIKFEVSAKTAPPGKIRFSRYSSLKVMFGSKTAKIWSKDTLICDRLWENQNHACKVNVFHAWKFMTRMTRISFFFDRITGFFFTQLARISCKNSTFTTLNVISENVIIQNVISKKRDHASVILKNVITQA